MQSLDNVRGVANGYAIIVSRGVQRGFSCPHAHISDDINIQRGLTQLYSSYCMGFLRPQLADE